MKKSSRLSKWHHQKRTICVLQGERNRMWLCHQNEDRAWQASSTNVRGTSSKEWRGVLEKQSVEFRSCHPSESYAGLDLKRSIDVTRVQQTLFQRSCYPNNLTWVGWTCTHKCSMLSSAINSDDFSPSSASGRASIALRSCSHCFERCWFACRNDNTNASYSGRTALHPGHPSAPRAGIRRSCPHTRVVLSTSRSLNTIPTGGGGGTLCPPGTLPQTSQERL